MGRVVGVSSGALYQSCDTKHALRLIAAAGCQAVELGFVKNKNWEWLAAIQSADVAPFSYVSFHAPIHDYAESQATRDILHRIVTFHQTVRPLDLVIFHPDVISDFAFLASIDLPIAIENMDRRKKDGQTAESLIHIISNHPDWRVVLDINHAWTNDPSLGLAQTIIDALAPTIVQIHLSGFIERHEPLFRTQQISMFDIAKQVQVPIILESILKPEELARELAYVQTGLREK